MDSGVPTGEVTLGVPRNSARVSCRRSSIRFVTAIPPREFALRTAAIFRSPNGCSPRASDVGFLYDPHTYQNLPVKMTVEETLYLVGRRASRNTGRATIPFRLVAKLPSDPAQFGSTLRQRVEDAAAQLNIKAKYEVDIDSLPAIKQLVIEGAGHTILPYAAVHEEVKRGLLSVSRIVEPDFHRPLGLAVRPNCAVGRDRQIGEPHPAQNSIEFLAKGNWMGREVAKSALKSAIMAPTTVQTSRAERNRGYEALRRLRSHQAYCVRRQREFRIGAEFLRRVSG